MTSKDVIRELRLKHGLSQDELAEKVFVTRQAVSRWEMGETTPGIDTLKLLSKLFDVSINTLLGAPRQMVCHCCGMELDDATTSKETDGVFNEDYCQTCYRDGQFTLDAWRQYVSIGGEEAFGAFKQQLMDEINALHVEGLPKVERLNVLPGSYINLAYPLPGGKTVQFLDDDSTYLGNQLECTFGGTRCFGIAAGLQFILICTYEANGANPELVLYKQR